MNEYVWVASVVWRSSALPSILGVYSTEENAKDACVAFAADELAASTLEIEWQNYLDILFVSCNSGDKYRVEGFELDAS